MKTWSLASFSALPGRKPGGPGGEGSLLGFIGALRGSFKGSMGFWNRTPLTEGGLSITVGLQGLGF